jgi:hypothetical protein
VKLVAISEESECLKANSNRLEKENGKNKDIRALNRDIHDFKNIYQTITNIVNDENGDRVADPHSICLGARAIFLTYWK